MYDALYYACRDKLLKQPQAGPVRRVIILLSDGNDKASSVTREKAIEMAQRAEPIRGVLQAGGVQDRWALPHHQSSSAEPERPAHPLP
jgi:hypothetical protein